MTGKTETCKWPLLWPPEYAGSPSLIRHENAFHGLCRSSVVMVEPTQHRNGNHLVWVVWERGRKRRRVRDPLPKPLMRSSLIEGQNRGASGGGRVVSHGRSENDRDMLASRSPGSVHRSHSRVRYGVRSTLMPLVVATRAKFGPNLRSVSRSRYRGLSPYGVASRNCCATQGSMGDRVTFT